MASLRDATMRWPFLAMLCVAFCFMLLNRALFHDLESSFLMSIVFCDDPAPPCPPGSLQQGDVCVAEPPGSPAWSFSKHCIVRTHVLNSGKDTVSLLGTAEGVAHASAIFFLGPLVDWLGRKPMLLLAFVGATIRPMMQYGSSLLIGHTDTQDLINVAAAAIASAVDVLDPALSAMAADMSENQIELRNRALSVLSQVRFLAGATGFAGGFAILHQNLESYSGYWLVSVFANVMLCLAACVLLKETMHLSRRGNQGAATATESAVSSEQDPEASDVSLEHRQPACEASRSALRDLAIFAVDVGRDSVLMQVLVLKFVQSATLTMEHLGRYFLISYMDYSQAAASLVGVATFITAFIGSRLNVFLMPRLGSWTTLLLSFTLAVAGSVLQGVSVRCADASIVGSNVLFWSGRVMLGISLGIRNPLLNTIASVQMDAGKQGRIFSMMELMELAGFTVGMSVLYRQLFNSSWTGWLAPISCFVGAGIYSLCCCWVLILRRRRNASATSSGSLSK